MSDLTAMPSPFGLGWTRRLALASAPPGTPVREAFDRQLLVGAVAASSATFALGGVIALLLGSWFDAVGSFVPAVVLLAILLAFLGRGGATRIYGHLFLVLLYPAPVLGAIAIGGMVGWMQMVWALTFPALGALLTGIRGGLVWLGMVILGFAAFAATEVTGFRPFTVVVDPAWLTPPSMAVNFAIIAGFQLVLVGWFIQQRDIVEGLYLTEQAKAVDLLRNVLPGSVADRLRNGEVVADHFDEVTVVFADLVGFTALSAGLPPRRVVAMLAEVFGEIDRIAAEEGMEKVKTIGDCYMAVAGAPEPCDDHADRAMRFAVRVRDRVVGWKHFGTELSVRVGVHSGPVMGGILGNTRLLYDLWGDTVNAASRLESSGVAGEVQVSEPTVRLCVASWDLEDRGVVQLRGRSGMRSFIVRGPGGPGAESTRSASRAGTDSGAG